MRRSAPGSGSSIMNLTDRKRTSIVSGERLLTLTGSTYISSGIPVGVDSYEVDMAPKGLAMRLPFFMGIEAVSRSTTVHT